jgi:hypothetical protein
VRAKYQRFLGVTSQFPKKIIILDVDHNMVATLGAEAACELTSDQSTSAIPEYLSSPVFQRSRLGKYLTCHRQAHRHISWRSQQWCHRSDCFTFCGPKPPSEVAPKPIRQASLFTGLLPTASTFLLLQKSKSRGLGSHCRNLYANIPVTSTTRCA